MVQRKLEGALNSLLGGTMAPAVDPSTIPCQETSDVSSLPHDPLVSVRIVTYNHEPYLRRCLDGVLMQQTKFPFEIVIGEDCSKDRTREICFEYQKKYPDKIRVLWAEENVYKRGGNQARTLYHCRGRYVALLEGDDYWTDSLKLQKQIDLIQARGAQACVANYETLARDGSLSATRYEGNELLTHQDLAHFYPHTATYVLERDLYFRLRELYPGIRIWYDVVLMHCLVENFRVVHLWDVVSVYRMTGAGMATRLSDQEQKLLAVKQYLDLYLHGPRTWHKRFGALVMTYVAFFFKRATKEWSSVLMQEKASVLKIIFWRIYLRQLWDLRSLRAFLRYVRFRLGFHR